MENRALVADRLLLINQCLIPFSLSVNLRIPIGQVAFRGDCKCESVDVQFEDLQTLFVLSRASFRQTLKADRPIDRETSENRSPDLAMKSIARRKRKI
jgi:hypothetical protein